MTLRAARLESGMFTYALDEVVHTNGPSPLSSGMLADDLPITRAQNHNFAMAQGFRRRAVEDFERLKALRSEMPNTPFRTMSKKNKSLPPSTTSCPRPLGFVYNPQIPDASTPVPDPSTLRAKRSAPVK
jgi:hypothetical protein